MNSQDWKSLGKFINIHGNNLFVIDKGEAKQTMVVLHGYPTSTYDYHKVYASLAKHYRLIMHDHLGFGFSDKLTNASYSLIHQADRALNAQYLF